MKTIAWLWVIPFAWAQIGEVQDLYDASAIVLKDGRVLDARGDVEYLGDEVYFTDNRGEQLVLNVALVDREKSEKLTAKMREKNEQGRQQALANDGSLYSKITKHQETRGERGRASVEGNRELKKAVEHTPVPNDGSYVPDLDGLVGKLPVDDARVQEWAQNWQEQINNNVKFRWVLIVGMGLLLVFTIVYLITVCVLIRVAFREDHGVWGVLLSAIVMAGLLGKALVHIPVVGMAAGFLSLSSIIMFPLFIFLHCEGRRIKFLLLWGSPFIWGIIWLGALFALAASSS